MASHVRTATCTALLLLLSTLSVFASSSPVRVVIKPSSEKVEAIRYRTGSTDKGHWQQMDPANLILELNAFDKATDRLFVQQKETGQDWSRSYEYRYETQINRWNVTLPVARKQLYIDSMDIKPYALFPAGSSSALYSLVIGASLKLNLSLDERNPLYGYGEAGYSRGPSKSDWVDVMQAVNVSAGMGYRIRFGKNMEIAPELGYGLVLHLLQGDLDQDGTESLETFIDQQVRLSLNFSIAPTESYELFAAPLGVLFFEKSKAAVLYGFQVGMRFNF